MFLRHYTEHFIAIANKMSTSISNKTNQPSMLENENRHFQGTFSPVQHLMLIYCAYLAVGASIL